MGHRVNHQGLCCSVVRRVASLHQNLANALAKSEAAMKQAKGVSDHCEQLMDEIEELKVHLWFSFLEFSNMTILGIN